MILLGAKGAGGGAWEQRHMRVLRHPLVPDSLSPQHHRRPSRAVKSLAVLPVAGGLEHRHANCREAFARHNGAQVIKPPAELIDMAPDVTPLLLLGCVTPLRERRIGAKGNQVIGEERPRACEVHCLNADLERSKPAADQGHIVVLLSHSNLQGLRLGGTMLLLCQQPVKP